LFEGRGRLVVLLSRRVERGFALDVGHEHEGVEALEEDPSSQVETPA